ncbi:aldehyde dehydrogenase [uncultured Rikenella sp.]|uniref:aldehyde dehydrogenase n=1 Tax=uncultured Rikenella sp. TaxID=368003 RepID=UPI00260EF875|nr:aldehyde dehydrogenase [uncultured Rikenella sp.]
MNLLDSQRAFFASGRTRAYDFRRDALQKLKSSVRSHLRALYDALWQDLHKSEAEAYLTEAALVLREIDDQLSRLRSRMRPRRVGTPVFLWPSRSRILCEPFGNILILAPWNYPFQLAFAPLAGAIAAGNCVVLKPSPYTPHVSAVMRQIVESAFPADYIAVVEGHRDVNEALLAERWDYIFFTGSPELGRTVMRAAAEHLTPVTLELGGKSPCIADNSANVDIAARRIVWGKFLNAGQTCIAPDYLLVHENIKSPLIERIEYWIEEFYGAEPGKSPHYGRMVNRKAFDRVCSYLSDGTILTGGDTDPAQRYIAPTLLDLGAPTDSVPVMQSEIFGPVLPLMSYTRLDEAVEFINRHEKPLALYYFGSPETGRNVLQRTSSGGACINDTVLHVSNDRLPFGGVGNSGMGRYHGKESFLTFSNRRSVLCSAKNWDLPLKYPPYKHFGWITKLLGGSCQFKSKF